MSFIYNILAILFVFAFSVNAKAAEQGLYKSGAKEDQGFKRLVIEPRQMGHDPRFKSIPFTPNTTARMTLIYDNPSYIEFAPDEVVNVIMNPKKTAWQLVSQGNKLFIKPLESDADTQVTIMTNKRVYYIELYAKEPEGNFDRDYTFSFTYKYPSDEDSKTIRTYAKSILPDIDRSPWKYNFNYTMTGEDKIYPVKIFDDGEFTYFEFGPSAVMPAVFSVDSNGFESLINYRIVGSYLIVEEVSDRFTLRNGAEITCIFNENTYKSKKSKTGGKPPQKEYNPNIDGYNSDERNYSGEVLQYQP